MESKQCIAPPPANEIETSEIIPALRTPAIEAVQATAPTPVPRKPRSDVRAAAALFVFLLGLMTVAGGAVVVVLFG